MMVILVTLMLTTAVILVIAKFNNVNVFDTVKEMTQSLPFVKTDEEQEQSQNDVILEGRVVELQAKIHEKGSCSCIVDSDGIFRIICGRNAVCIGSSKVCRPEYDVQNLKGRTEGLQTEISKQYAELED